MAPQPRDVSPGSPPTARPQDMSSPTDDPPAAPSREGRPPVSRPRGGAGRGRPGRLRRGVLTTLVAASVAVPVAGAARPPAVPAPVPAPVQPLRAAGPAALADRYAASRAAVRDAERMAAAHGHLRRAASLHAMAGPARTFLFFDGRDGGRAAEVFGDLSRAGRVAVLVPGVDTNLDRYGRLQAGASALHQELRARSASLASVASGQVLPHRPRTPSGTPAATAAGPAAVVAWLGYRTPGTFGVEQLTAGLAERAAPGLRRFVRELRAARPGVRAVLVCHSYGSVVCARAAAEPGISDVVLYGSPGVGADHVSGLRTGAGVWAGRGAGDWISVVPHTRVRLPFAALGHGTDPVSPEFGARVFPAGGGGHSDYLRPESVALANIARIVLGQAPDAGVRHD